MLNFQRLFESLPGLYIIYDLDFVIVGGSDAYFQATLTKREEVVGRHLFEVFPDNPDDPNADGVRNLRASLESVLKYRKPHTMAVQKYDIRRPDSVGGGFEERYWTPVNLPLFDENGEMTHIIHRVEDVTEFVRISSSASEQRQRNQTLQSRTEQMEMEIYARAQELRAVNEQLQTANEALSELDRAKTTFFSNVSHEFRTPLTLMLSPLEDTIRNLNGTLPPSELEQLQLVQRNGLRLLKLVNSLLDFSRIEAGRVQAAYEPVDLATYTAELASTFRSLIEQVGLELIVDCPPLPEAIYVDREMWEKIVLNLLSNAFKFTLAGTITVRLQWADDHVELSVADTGVGIPSEELPHLFERFHRVENSQSRSFEGSGIGLSLVQELVKLHGGEIGVSSTFGQGSCFTVTIPTGTTHLPSERIGTSRTLVSTAVGALPYVEEAQRWLATNQKTDVVDGLFVDSETLVRSTEPSSASTSAARILLADDNADMRHYIQRLLSGTYTVETVADGVAAMTAIANHPPDLVLTDMMMPGMNGFELLLKLRSNPQTGAIPIILLSARAGEEARLEGLAKGADDYLIKPFSVRELLARVEATLKLSKLRHEALQQEQTLRAASVTAQQNAEAAFRRIDQLLESMSEAFIALDHDWRIIYQNAAAERINNKPRSQVLGKTLWSEWPAAVGSISDQQYRHALAEQVAVHFEQHYYEPPDHDVWLEFHAYPFEEGLGIFYRNISDRKRREANTTFLAEIADDLSRLSTANEIVQVIGAKIGAYLKITTCNFYEVDESRDEITVSYSWGDTNVPSLLQTFRITEYLTEEFGRASRAGETIVIRDTQIDPRTDSQSYAALKIHAFVTVPFHQHGSWKCFLCVTDERPRDWRDDELQLIQELSNRIFPRLERSRAESALRESEQRFRLMADAVPQIVWLTDAQGRVEFFNKQWSDYTGVPYEPTTAALIAASFVHPDDGARTMEAFNEARRGSGVFSVEHRIRSAAGTYRWFLVRAEPYRDQQTGEIVRWFGASIDIHDRKQAEAEREQLLQREQIAREAAETANRIKDEFLAILSHELRSPLNPILGWSRLLQQGKLDAHKTKTALATIERNAKLQAQLIEDLLDISRIMQGKLSLTAAPVSLNFVISAAVETVRLAAEAKNIQILLDLDTAIAPISGDAARLQQVVWNLLTNAVKFTPNGGQVTVELRPTHGFAQIRVIDTGKGIHPNFLPHVFEYFRQEDGSTTRKFGGLGLGLAIVRQIVEMHGGTVKAESQGENQGATFIVQLPIMQQATSIASEPTRTQADAEAPLDNVQILLVDDEPDTREFQAFLLEQSGAKVTAVASGLEALQALEQFTPDVLVSDVGMAEMDGYMLMQQIRSRGVSRIASRLASRGRTIPAIALSAYAADVDQQKALQAGFQAHLSKPVEPEVLVKAIIKLCLRN